ncbi:MAG: hypothetical protein ABIF18_00725 [archaeon]
MKRYKKTKEENNLKVILINIVLAICGYFFATEIYDLFKFGITGLRLLIVAIAGFLA